MSLWTIRLYSIVFFFHLQIYFVFIRFVVVVFFSPCTSKDIIYTCYWAGRISVWTKSVQTRHCKMKDWGPFTLGPRPRPNISSPPCLSYEIRLTHFQNRCWFGRFPCQQSFCLVVYHACVCVCLFRIVWQKTFTLFTILI